MFDNDNKSEALVLKEQVVKHTRLLSARQITGPRMSRGRVSPELSFEIFLKKVRGGSATSFSLIVIPISMLTEIDESQLSHKKHRNSKDKKVEKSEKKRKRNAADQVESELASPTKKHRSNRRPRSPRALLSPAVPPPEDLFSPFYQQTSSFYLPLPPISQKHALQGICAEHISPLILTYYQPFHGVVISYSNARLSTNPQTDDSTPTFARAIDEYASSFIWLTADFVIFKPRRGSMIEGYVNLQSESTIGLLCLNFFNASVHRRRIPEEWKWIPGGTKVPWRRKLKESERGTMLDSDGAEKGEDDAAGQTLEDAEGYFQDQAGRKIEGLLRFRVVNVDTSKSMDRETGFVSIEGTMLSEDEEKRLQEQEKIRIPYTRRKQMGWQSEPSNAMTGAIVNEVVGTMDADDPPSSKYRARD